MNRTLSFVFGFIAVCFWNSAGATNVRVLFEENFTKSIADMNSTWNIAGAVIGNKGFVKTTSEPNFAISGLKTRQSFALPHIRKGDTYALRLEWSVKPVVLGSINDPFDNCDYKWGAEMRAMGGRYHQPDIQVQVPFVVGLDKNMVFLNTTRQFAMQPKLDGWQYFSVDFTAESVLSFKMNGREMLSEPIDAYKEGPAKEVHIRLADYAGTKSSTCFGPVKLCKVEPEDDLAWRIATWKIRDEGDANQSSCLLWSTASPMEKLFREVSTFSEKISHIYKLSAAANEYESFQVAVIPIGEKLSGIELKASDLISSTGTRISATNFKWNVVGYVQTKDAYTSGSKVNWNWPDPLMPGAKTDANAGSVQPFWVTVYVPAGTAAGDYKGIITIVCDKGTIGEVMVEATVFGFDLPKTSSLYTAFAFCPQTWVLWHKADEIAKLLPEEKRGRFEHLINIDRKMLDLLPKEKWQQVYDMLLAHRISPTFYYQPTTGGEELMWPFVEDWQYCADRGMNTLALACASIDWETAAAWWASPYKGNKKGYMDALCTRIDKFLPATKKLNWNGLVYVYGFDESDMQKDHDKIHDPAIKEIYGLIGTKYPGLKRASANPVNPTHYGLFDIWVPVTYQVDYDATARRQALGEQMWCYVCCGPGKPMSNFFIDYPGVDHRVLFWELSRARISGLLYWAMNYYMAETNWNKPGPRWPDVPWNGHTFNTTGDGFLIYPGKNATPLSCLRLENIRDGIEDYDYLSLLQKMLAQAQNKNVPAELIARAEKLCQVPLEISASFLEHTYNPQLLEKQRIKVGSAIEELSVYINKIK